MPQTNIKYLILLLMIPLVVIALCASIWLTTSLSRPRFPMAHNTDAIAFSTLRDPGQQIYIMRADGAYQTRLTYTVRYIHQWIPIPVPFGDMVTNAKPAPAPDGDGVVFLSDVDGQYKFYQIEVDGSNQHVLPTPTKDNVNVVLSPNGQRVAFIKIDGTLAVINVDGSAERCLTCSLSARVSTVAWSPDGTRLAFALGQDQGNALYRINVDGTNLVRLTPPSDANNISPAWSPDGQQIAFASNRDNINSSGIYVMNADGGAVVRLTLVTPPSGIAAGDGSPAWSPNGRKIAFSSSRDGPSEIYVMNADGTEQTRLTFTGRNGYPSWIHIK
jgi:Tol biopolymer transport system component